MGAATSYLKALFGATEKENEWDKKSRPIHFAANDGKPLLIKILLWKGAGVDAKDEDGLTALHLAAENGHIDAVNALLAGGARIDAQDNRTWEALHLAAQNGHVEMIKLLLHAGAKYHSPKGPADGVIELKNQPNRRAIGGRDAEYLFGGGRNRRLFDHRTPLELAEEQHHEEAVATLLDWGRAAKYVNAEASATSDPGNTKSELVVLETKAFEYTAQAFYDYRQTSPLIAARIQTPYKLLNIRTGELEQIDHLRELMVYRTRFVIVSYMWRPPKQVADCLFDKRIVVLEEGEAGRSEFESRVNRACKAFPDCATTFNADEALDDIKFPDIPHGLNLNKDYLREVYLLAAQEARRRGIDHIWIDALCIDQSDEDDKTRNLYLMDKYYASAECCVAISDVMRRRICPDRVQADINTDWQSGDDLLFWIGGVHCSRVWLFQEIYSARELVTCGGGLRIDTKKFIEIYKAHLEEPSHVSSNLCSDPDHVLFKAFIKQYVTMYLPTLGGERFSVDDGLDNIRYRNCASSADRVYGVLATFSTHIIEGIPVDYRLPFKALYPILIYARICDGDVNGLLILRRAGEEKHEIVGAPSWIPTGVGAKFCDGHGKMLRIISPGCSVHFPRVLRLKMSYLPIAKLLKASATTQSGQFMDYNVLVTLGSKMGLSGLEKCEGAIEPIEYCPDQEGAHEQDAIDYNAAFLELQTAVREGRVVAALLENGKPTDENAELPTTRGWVMLCAGRESETWTRKGVLRTSQNAVNVSMKQKWFRIL